MHRSTSHQPDRRAAALEYGNAADTVGGESKMATRTRAAAALLQLHIQLADIKPAIWRRVIVPETITLAKLHLVIQVAMGWTDSHLHEFEIAGKRYGIPDPDDAFGPSVVAESRARLGASLMGMRSFRYVYDFGDDWVHKIKVEKMLPPDACAVPTCIGGANACPPEDVGGPYGYSEFLHAMADPAHPEHEDLLEWNGGPFDAAELDLEAIECILRSIKL
jgi:hypothetical protein